MNKEKYFIDLSKCSGEQIENIYNTVKETGFIKPNFYTDKDFMMLKFCTIEERWGCSGKNWDGLKYKTELTYPEFIKLFEEPTKLPSELLKEYFKNTPREQVLKDWENTAHLDDVNSPKVSELFEGWEGENELEVWLIRQIEKCQELDMSREEWAFIQVLKKINSK